MQLMFFIGNDLIETVPLHQHKISEPGYLGSFKRTLKQKYTDLLRQEAHPPEFLIMPQTAAQSN